MRRFEDGRAVHASNEAGSRIGSLLGWAVGLVTGKPAQPVKDERPENDGGTLVRVTVYEGHRSEVHTVHGERLAVADKRAARVLAEQHFSERRRCLEDSGKVLSKLDVDVRCVDGQCELVKDHGAYVAEASRVAKATKEAKGANKAKAA